MESFSCLVCGKEYESVSTLQRYCSVKCRDRADKNDRRFGGVRDYIIVRDKFKCVDCGSKIGLCVHHKNQDRTCNDPDNLKTLCRSCHKKEHFDVVDRAIIKACVICGGEFSPLESKRDFQILCRKKECSKKYKVVKKRKEHEETACIICGKIFMQKFPRHHCCSPDCIKVHNDRQKAERYERMKEELKAKQIRYYQDNKEVRKTYIRQWQTENKEKVKAYKAKSLLKSKSG